MAWLRSRLTYANVMATIAVFVALGGSSYAALHIGTSQINDNSIRSKDLRDNDVRGKDVRRGTLTGSDVKDNRLTGRDVKESSLAKVPLAGSADIAGSAGNAGLLEGLPASTFERSDQIKRFGPLEDSTTGFDPGPEVSFGPVSFELFCQAPASDDIVGVASSEDHTVLSYTFALDDDTVHGFSTTNLGSQQINMASSSKPAPYAKTVEGWALTRSGFRMHFSIWFGRGILGAGPSTCAFGGELRRG
jgi:hypothetical protein